jgi:uncharacterized alkaline shock family protein YloU
MREIQKVDLGSVQIHRYVIADIAANAIADLQGLKLVANDFWGNLQELAGWKKYPGIKVSVDRNNQVTLDVKVSVEYGLSIPELASRAQDLIRDAIEQAADIDLKDVNINIRGIERGKS